MNNPGVYDLGDRTITGAMSGEVITVGSDGNEYVENLEGMLGANIEIRFSYGSGGTTCKVYVQTSLDQRTTWVDVICASMTTASENLIFNLSGLTAKTTPATVTDGSLADDTAVDGILGDTWRVKVTTTGTYASSTSVGVRLTAR